ncbi:DNA-binding domain-containing protein [Rivibacter subsaxonicus]|uniref:Putative DNA-binding protein n=1 Tax=Rivibacter subsaxonicus TaxID=457575 RepID=A0A4Q7VNK0_9BURK|nr:DNA-binding domain-containing protein [Rivibacter subsaxonicus]RZT97933.1 putative DNA-binding protein [Rivibacter subsaxonicus]
MTAAMSEARRQQAVLAAILGAEPALVVAGGAAALARGLAVYRTNAGMVAERALAARHPLLQQMLGDEGLVALARGLWRAHPPRRGDLAQWGHELPDLIECQAEFEPWPWLADVARLELAIAEAEAAADAPLETQSLQLLAEHAPDALCIDLAPSLRLLQSAWPLLELQAAHAPGIDAAAQEAALAAVRLAVDERRRRPRPQHILIAREGWRAMPVELDAPTWRWLAALQQGLALDAALAAAGADFDVGAWLAQALSQGHLWRVR